MYIILIYKMTVWSKLNEIFPEAYIDRSKMYRNSLIYREKSTSCVLILFYHPS